MRPFHFILLLVFVFFLGACENDDKEAPKSPYADAEITTAIINSEDFGYTQGFGYEIHIDGKLFIRQPQIPAIGFNRVFQSAADAQKVADFVVYKIRQGILPPGVDLIELDSLKVINFQNLEVFTSKLDSVQIPPSEVYLTGWGFEIFMDNWLYLQMFRVGGSNQAFKTEQDALKVANFFVYHTKRGNPIQEITREQLDSLDIHYE